MKLWYEAKLPIFDLLSVFLQGIENCNVYEYSLLCILCCVCVQLFFFFFLGLVGTVKDKTGHPITDVVIEIESGESNFVAKPSVSRNEAVFKISLPVGKYRLIARHPDYAVERKEVVVKSEHINEIDIVLHRV